MITLIAVAFVSFLLGMFVMEVHHVAQLLDESTNREPLDISGCKPTMPAIGTGLDG